MKPIHIHRRPGPKMGKYIGPWISARLHEWNEIGKPLQLFESYYHREDANARELYLHVRALCVSLANYKEQYAVARSLFAFADSNTARLNGITGGVQLGYNYQFSQQ